MIKKNSKFLRFLILTDIIWQFDPVYYRQNQEQNVEVNDEWQKKLEVAHVLRSLGGGGRLRFLVRRNFSEGGIPRQRRFIIRRIVSYGKAVFHFPVSPIICKNFNNFSFFYFD